MTNTPRRNKNWVAQSDESQCAVALAPLHGAGVDDLDVLGRFLFAGWHTNIQTCDRDKGGTEVRRDASGTQVQFIKRILSFDNSMPVYERRTYEFRGVDWRLTFKVEVTGYAHGQAAVRVPLPVEGNVYCFDFNLIGDVAKFHRDLIVVRMFKDEEMVVDG